MAKPQKEYGYTQIANELLDALCRIDLNPVPARVLWFIIRMTYGYHKKADSISLSQIAAGTGLPIRSARRGKKWLGKNNFIIIKNYRKNKQNLVSEIALQKDYEKWIPWTLGRGELDPIGDRVTPDPGVGSRPHKGVGSSSCVEVGSRVTPTKDIKIKEREFSSSNLKNEVKTLKEIGWDIDKIKQHFLNTRGIPENTIDEALGKNF